jgi:hypothetical protein
LVILKSLGNSIEEPLLSQGIVSPSSLPDVVGTVALSNSVEWKLGHKVEWSVDVEPEFFVKSLGFGLYCINIDNLPSLVGSIMSLVNNNSLSLDILSSRYVQAFTILPIDKVFILILEDLEPLRVGTPDLHVIGLSSILDIE